MKKAIAISILLINACLADAQQPAPNFTINSQITTGSTYTASEFVKFTSGASFQGTVDASLRACIDPYLIFPPSAGLTGGPNAGDNGMVGTIEGQGSVGPMGNYIYTIPIKLPECLPGMTPGLSLVYNSSGGDGYLGHGWSLGGLSSISRTPSNIYFDNIVDPVDFDDNDRLALDGSRLIAVSGSYWGTDAEYRFEAENQMKVVPNGDGFKVYSPDGKISYYGSAVESRIWKPYGSSVQWFLDKIEDVFGNTIKIEYYHNVTSDGFSVVPKKISYNYNPSVANFTDPVYSVEFVYMDDEPTVKYSNQAAYHHDRVIETIVIKKGESEISHYDLTYDNPFYAGKLTIDHITYASAGNVLFFNPTRFIYSKVTDIEAQVSVKNGVFRCIPNSQGGTDCVDDFIPGDFNGDGYTDFIRVYQTKQTIDIAFYPPKTLIINTGWDLFINDKNGGFSLITAPVNNNNIVSQTGWSITSGSRIVPVNLNGDNKTDLIVFYDFDNFDFHIKDCDDYDAINMFQILIADASSPEFIPYPIANLPGNIIQRLSEFVVGDYNGDGLEDIFLNTIDLWDHNSGAMNWQYCFLTQIDENNIVTLNQVNAWPGPEFNKFQNFRAINFDGDARAELSSKDCASNEAPQIISLNSSSTAFTPVFSGPSQWEYTYYGDFNGDGISDILRFTPQPDFDALEGIWTVSYGTGNSYTFPPEPVTFSLNIKPDGYLLDLLAYEIRDPEYVIGDFNGDGLDDVIEQYYDYRPTSINYDKMVTIIYFSKGHFNLPQRTKTIVAGVFKGISMSNDWTYTCDVNGDNIEDLLSRSWENLEVCSFVPTEEEDQVPEGLLHQVENGLGVKTSISYLPGKSSTVYSSLSSDLYEDTHANMFGSSFPGFVVSNLKTEVGLTKVFDDRYHYYSGLFHRKGKGFLGFEQVLVVHNLNDLGSLTKTKIFTDNTTTYSYVIPEIDYQKDFKMQEDGYIERRQTESIYTLLPGKRYRVLLSKQLTKTRDLLANLYTGTSRVVSSFDTYGQLIGQVECKSASELDFTSPDDAFEHRTETNTTYITPVNNLFGRPDVVTKTVYYKAPGASSFTSYTAHSDYAYYALSQVGYPLAKEVLQYADAAIDPMAVKKAIEYNAIGLAKKETLSCPNYVAPAGALAPSARITEKVYDEQRPYLVLSSKDPKGFTNQFEYDPFELYVASSADINSLITHSQSDILGIEAITTHPEGTKQVTCKRWAIVQGNPHTDKPDGGLYYIWSKTSGSGEILTFYNAFGQELRTVTRDIMGLAIYTDKTYDNRGRLISQTSPYSSSLTPGADITTTFSYDLFDRVRVTTTARGNASVDYEGFKTTYTDLMGHVSSRLVNAAGWLTESKDASGNSVQYLHDCRGNVILTWHSSQPQDTEIQNEYDSQGNCTRLIDPAAGTIDFVYDPFGQMLTRKDSRQANPSIYRYDVLGRMTSRTEPEGTTTWTYDDKPYGLGLPGSVSCTDHTTQYSYDDFSRVAEVTDQIKETIFTSKKGYDVYGRENRSEYPTGLVIITEYTASGHPGKLYKGGQDAGLIWAAVETDSYGRLTKTQHGNGALTFTEYEADRGLLTKQWTTNNSSNEIFRREYEWANGGNLNWRKKIKSGTTLTESFTYDNLDRLDVTYLNNQLDGNNDYDALGNVTGKNSYAGLIFEDPLYNGNTRNPYALISADVNTTLWPQAAQAIAYNSYNKMTTVTEGEYQLNISYGYDHQRLYQELKQNGVVVKKKTFAGNDLEIIEKPGIGSVQKIHYLTGGDGALFAMYVIDQNNEGRMYYIYTDHLGSPNLITDATGNVVLELSYDAWGKRRNPATWEPFTSTPEEPLIDRGFTFHEHLYPFTLINMNGRAYDPLVGRFLSADPYIQAPDNTQNLNRYSYCLNNPLRYSDPSGEWIPFVIGAVIGGIQGAMIGDQAGLKGLGLIGATLAGAGLGSLTAGAGTSAAASSGVIVGAIAGGAINGAGFGLVAGIATGQDVGSIFANMLNGGSKGAILGLAGGAVGGAIGGGWGAISGGATAGGLGAALNGGHGEDVLKGAVIGGALGWGLYHASLFNTYKESNIKENFKLSYNGFAKMIRLTQRSIFWGREGKFIPNTKGGVNVNELGDVNNTKAYTFKDYKDALFDYHTHQDWGNTCADGENFSTHASGGEKSDEYTRGILNTAGKFKGPMYLGTREGHILYMTNRFVRGAFNYNFSSVFTPFNMTWALSLYQRNN